MCGTNKEDRGHLVLYGGGKKRKGAKNTATHQKSKRREIGVTMFGQKGNPKKRGGDVDLQKKKCKWRKKGPT